MVTMENLLQRSSGLVIRCIIYQDGVCDQSPIQERSPLVGYVMNRRKPLKITKILGSPVILLCFESDTKRMSAMLA